MAGTVEGGKLTAVTNKKRYGEDYYERIGHKGGIVKGAKGFGASTLCKGCSWKRDPHNYARCAGAKGGKISKRGKVKTWKKEIN